jgi:hypothetical protein
MSTPLCLRPSRSCVLSAAVLALVWTASAAPAAPVSWVGPKLGGSWSVPADWSGGAVPGPDDDVTIAAATVAVGDAQVVGGTLTLSQNALLNVTGAAASLTVTGPAHVDDGRFFVSEGGQVSLPTVTSVVRTWCEPNLVVPEVDFAMVLSGGSLALPALQTFSTNVSSCPAFAFAISVLTDGTVDLSSLRSITPQDPHTATFSIGGAVDLHSLDTFTRTTVDVLGPAPVDLPALHTLTASTITVTNGQKLTANALTEATDVVLFAAGDDGIVMNALTAVHGAQMFVSPGTLHFPALTTLVDVSMQIQDGATVSAPNLTTYTATKSGAFLSGGPLDAPALRTLSNVNLAVAETVGSLSLPGVTAYEWSLCDGMGLGAINAGGGGKIDLSGVQTFTIDPPACGALGFNVGAVTGGTIDLSHVTKVVMPGGQSLGILAANAGSVVDLSALKTYPAARVLFLESDGGRVLRPAGGGGGGVDVSGVRTQLGEMRTAIAGSGVDRKARTKLGKVLTAADKKLTIAANGSTRKARRALRQTHALLVRFGKLVHHLQPKHITDAAVGTTLTGDVANALQDVEGLEAGLGT